MNSSDQGPGRDEETLRAAARPTRRATVGALEEILGVSLPVLDRGFVRVIDYMGDDAAIVQAARVSYGAGNRTVKEDRALINYLMRNRHTSPFEMCEIKLHVKLPIFVARQWVRHRTASLNEQSARYSILEREFYIPAAENLGVQSTVNRQGRSDVLDARSAGVVLDMLTDDAVRAHEHYEWLLNETVGGKVLDPGRQGIARELARMDLTLNVYTQWYWKIDLYNLFHFLMLRCDPRAQYEIRAYAEVILDRVVKLWVPWAYEAFAEYQLCAATLSRTAIAAVRRMLKGEQLDAESAGMGRREWQELRALLAG